MGQGVCRGKAYHGIAIDEMPREITEFVEKPGREQRLGVVLGAAGIAFAVHLLAMVVGSPWAWYGPGRFMLVAYDVGVVASFLLYMQHRRNHPFLKRVFLYTFVSGLVFGFFLNAAIFNEWWGFPLWAAACSVREFFGVYTCS